MKRGDIILHVWEAGGKELREEFKVQWVLCSEAGATSVKDGGGLIFSKVEGTWKSLNHPSSRVEVLVEATPTYQSEVASMTDEQLTDSLEALRNRRSVSQKVTRVPKVSSSSDKGVRVDMEKIMAQVNLLPEADRAEVLKAMGLPTT